MKETRQISQTLYCHYTLISLFHSVCSQLVAVPA